MTATTIIIWITVLLTSTLSGVLGMGGGVILMLTLLAIMPVAEAMIVHGVIQFVANGTRALTHRQHIWWRSVGWYVVGSLIAVTVLSAVQWMPQRRLVYLVGGILPLLQFLPLRRLSFDIARGEQALVCGGIMTVGQVAAGAAGPLLDAFFNHFERGRYGILATKSATQVVAHSVKVAYFLAAGFAVAGGGFGSATSGRAWSERVGGGITLGGGVLLAVLGTGLGTKLLAKISDRGFSQVSRGVLVVLSLYSLAKAALQ